MVRIRYKVAMAGKGFSIAPGEEGTVGADEAARLIAAGFAEPVGTPRPETATRTRKKA